MLMIGLMSGTSADAVDAALVEWPDAPQTRPFALLAEIEAEHSSETRARIHRIAAGGLPSNQILAELVGLDVLLGEAFALAAQRVAEHAGVSLERIAGIASHGQTVVHHPEIGGSLQIGSPSIIAERTGCSVVADFRSRDLAAGGQGAPLAPFFHHAVFTDEAEGRAVLNLGGIANLTWLPPRATADEVAAFDVGPANSLVDGVISILSGGAEGMDRDGCRALAGHTHDALLAELLSDDYLDRPPPKSTGLDRYGPAACGDLVRRWKQVSGGRPDDDLLATLVAFTAEAVGRALREWLPASGQRVDRLLVGGGGVRNPAMMSSLREAVPNIPIDPFDDHGVPSGAAEAMAFSLMGRNALEGLPNHLPKCTGASREAPLGVVVPGR